MKIAINLLPYRKLGGILIYAHNILKALGEIDRKNQYYLIGYKNLLSPLVFDFPNFHYIETSLNPFSGFQRVIVEQFTLPSLLKKNNIELLYNLSVSGPLFWRGKIISTIHDCSYRRYHQGRSLGAILYLETMFYLSPRLSKKIIAVSEFTKQELIKIYKAAPQKIEVIHEAVPQLPNPNISFETIQKKFGIEKPYFFWIGVSMPWKNISFLIEAFQKFSTRCPQFHLVLAGELTREEKQKLQDAQRIIFLGKISDQEKVVLYQHSKGFVFPSLYEGFGLPVLEAQSLGVPVLTSNVASLPEVAGDGALFVNPYSIDDIVQGMYKIAMDKNLRKYLINKGYENVKRFSWEKAARQLIKVFEKVYYEKNPSNK